MLDCGISGVHRHNSAATKAVIDVAGFAMVVGYCLWVVRASYLYRLASVSPIADTAIATALARKWACAIGATDRAGAAVIVSPMAIPGEACGVPSLDVHHNPSA